MPSPTDLSERITRPCTLSLVVPCFNEESTLDLCVERVLGLRSDQLKLEIIIVDDCSTDQSLKIAHSLQDKHPEVIVLRQEANLGKGAALRAGFARATGDFVGVQDADLEYEPLEYLKLLEPLLMNKAD